MERVVITGMGFITPIGSGIPTVLESLKRGKNGIGPITRFDTSDSKAVLAAEVRDFDPERFMDKKEVRRTDRYCRYAIAAAQLAYENAGLSGAALNPERCGVIIGSGVGGLETLEEEHRKLSERGASRVSPLFIPMMISNMAAGQIAINLGFKGISYSPVSACATGSHAVGEAYRAIRGSFADICVAGGSEAAITPLAVAGFTNMTALSRSSDPNAASLPFDARRAGFVMGEGAGILILEGLSSAKARNARIYAEIVGYGATTDAYHITGPDPDGVGAAKAMSLAIEESGLEKAEFDYVNAHGTGTEMNDKIESRAIERVFGELCNELSISSTKSMTGHMLGAAGGVEAAFSALAITEGFIPPTINLNEPDPECALNYTPNRMVEKNVRAALSNSFGFGGHNVSIAIKKFS